jgi:hypothetical protein
MERRRSGPSFNYDELFTRGHKYKHLFDITAVNNNDDDTNVYNMMIGTDQSPVQGRPPMYLTGVVSGTGVHILVNTGSTHNIINIDADILYINAYLLDIGNNIIIDTPWLAGLRCLTWDFTTMQLQYICNRRLFTVTTVQRRHAPATILALPAPPPIERATRDVARPPPRNILSRPSRVRHPNALNLISTWGAVDEVRQAVQQQWELCQVATTINDMTAPAWPIDQELFFFNEHFYIPTTISFMVYLLDGLLFDRPANMRLPALGLHPTPTAPDDNASPSTILLGHPWLQDTVSPNTVNFLDDPGHQLLSVENIYINLRHNYDEPDLPVDIFNGHDISQRATKQSRSTRTRCLAKGGVMSRA